MSLCLFVHIRLFIYLFIYLYIYLFIYSFTFPFWFSRLLSIFTVLNTQISILSDMTDCNNMMFS